MTLKKNVAYKLNSYINERSSNQNSLEETMVILRNLRKTYNRKLYKGDKAVLLWYYFLYDSKISCILLRIKLTEI